jgi:CPA2 family monovalent cation:H+ antiporter-2
VPFDELPPELSAAPVRLFRVAPDAWAAGRTLGEIDLRAGTGATILAIKRKDRTITSPAADVRLAAGDDLYLMGDEAHVRVAQHRLAQGPAGESGRNLTS